MPTTVGEVAVADGVAGLSEGRSAKTYRSFCSLTVNDRNNNTRKER